MRHLPSFGRAATAFLLACLANPLQAARDVDGAPIEKVGKEVPVDIPSTYYTQLHTCPKSCSAKQRTEDWTLYPSVERLTYCDKPMLVDFAVFNPLDDPTTGVMLKACTLGNNANATTNPPFNHARSPKFRRAGNASTPSNSECLRVGDETKVDFELVRASGSDQLTASADLPALLQGISESFQDATFCNRTSLFGYANGTAVGLYLGNSFGKATVASTIESLTSEIKQHGSSASVVAQLCGNVRNASQTPAVGISIEARGPKGLASVQEHVASWARGKCVDSQGGAKGKLAGVNVWENTSGANMGNSTVINNGTSGSNGTHLPVARGRSSDVHELYRRGDCTTTTVASGDSCGALAQKCGISGSDFTKYNPAKDLCSTLQPNQKVCCSAGTIPTPKQNADGTCATYLVQEGDTCKSLALSNGITVNDIESFNKGTTWAWSDCPGLQRGINICLSKGSPPLPAPYDNAICGPVMPGTTTPKAGTNISELNPCPLNACCDVWGQCGITSEFCTIYKSPSGNPGYTPPGKAACISNCGQDIVNKDSAPAAYQRVGYWESWNFDRPCLNLKVQHANTDGSYTHIHWAFGNIDSNFNPTINDTFKQWGDFISMTDVKRVISFGGWGYSTSPATYDVLRQAMAPANRDKFVTNVVNFVNANNLDGVDFDWEYPGAPDLPDIPPGQKDDGANYLKFLATLKGKLPAGKSLSIAAPASYWYLKAFPIAKMASYLDYIVYMTYDLHGQWDAGNTFSVEGCPAGNCLRSHVNLTETTQVLAMVTKAGVPTNKIFVGESSYGRSFGMADPHCTGPMCAFTGTRTQSTAQPGLCTKTGGYISNAEIYNLLALGDNATTWYDKDSNSDIMTWNNGQWVSFMSEDTRSSRRSFWKGLNFRGTIDWAVDLQSWADEGNFDDDDDQDYLPPGSLGWDRTSCTGTYSSLEAIQADKNIPFYCAAKYMLQFLQANLTASMKTYDDLMGHGYDGKFGTYADTVVKGSSKQVDTFMRQNGNTYFTCVVTEMQFCCDKCAQQAPGFPGACTYCFKGGDCCKNPTKMLKRDRPPPPTNGCGVLSGPNAKYTNLPEPCPPDYSKRGLGRGNPITDTVYWTLKDDQSDKFYAALYSETGISKENIALKDINHSECTPSDSKETCRLQNWDIGIPSPEGYDKSDVLNPKDTVSKAYGNLENLKGDDFTKVINQVGSGKYGGDPMDLVDALSLPIFMISDAIDGMNQVVKVADEIDHAKMMAIIFGFLTAIFFFIPIAGELAGEVAALAGISRIAALIGAAGNAAMDIYQIVDTKGNDPLAIFSLITAPFALGNIGAISKAANLRRGMKPDDVKGLGKVKAKLDIVDDIKLRGVCTRGKKRGLEDEMSELMRLGQSPARSQMPRNALSMDQLGAMVPDSLVYY